MRPIFPNSAALDVRENLLLSGGRRTKVALQVRYGLLQHPTFGPVLIDTGYSPRVTHAPGRSLMLRLYQKVLKARLNGQHLPAQVLRHQGYRPADVQRIIVTHFHADHVAGLRDFPNAQFILHRPSLDAILGASKWQNLRHGVFPELLPPDIADRVVDVTTRPIVEAPLGLGAGRDLMGDNSLLGVDLPGHASGHFGICFAQMAQPLLFAVDTQWMLAALSQNRMPRWPATMVAADRQGWIDSTQMAAQFRQNGGTVVLAHDPEATDFDWQPPDA